MAYKRISPIPVVEGGIGATSLTGILTGNGTSAVIANAVTQHGVLIGGASNAASSLSVGATGTVLSGSTGADPGFTATPSVTSISFDSGTNNLSTFTDWASWTPTIAGSITAGTTTYTTQFGTYMRIGNLVIAQFLVSCTAATGTGSVNIGGLPFTINNTASYVPLGSIEVSGAITWPVATTCANLYGEVNTTVMFIICTGSAATAAFLQMTNTTLIFVGSLIYRV